MWKVFRVSGAFPCWTWISPESWLSKIPIGFKRWESFSIIAHHEVLVQWFSRKGWPTPPFAPNMSQLTWIYITTQDAIVTTRHETCFLKATRESRKATYTFILPQFCLGGIYISKIPTTKNTLQKTNISPKNGILKMMFLFPRVGYVSSLEGTSFLGYVFAFSSTWNFEVAPRGWQLRSPNSETFLQFLSSEDDQRPFWGVGVGVWGRKNRKTQGEVSRKKNTGSIRYILGGVFRLSSFSFFEAASN